VRDKGYLLVMFHGDFFMSHNPMLLLFISVEDVFPHYHVVVVLSIPIIIVIAVDIHPTIKATA